MSAFERLLRVNRGNPPEPLKISFPLHLALDKSWCEEFSRSLMRSNKWTINEATEALVDHLPDRSGLYMFVWRIPFPFPTHTNLAEHHFRVIVYVGQAGGRHSGNTLQKRYRQEYARIVGTHPEVLWQNEGETRDDRIERVLNLRDLEYWYHDNISETDTLEFYENQLIALFGPKGNSKGNSSDGRLTARLGKAVPAF